MAYGSVLTDVVQSSTTGTPPQFNDGSGTQVGTLCRAWVNFAGTASSGLAAINASFNVSSVTVNATGDFTVNFTNALSDTNYCMVTGLSEGSGYYGASVMMKFGGTKTTSSVEVTTKAGNSATLIAYPNVYLGFFR